MPVRGLEATHEISKCGRVVKSLLTGRQLRARKGRVLIVVEGARKRWVALADLEPAGEQSAPAPAVAGEAPPVGGSGSGSHPSVTGFRAVAGGLLVAATCGVMSVYGTQLMGSLTASLAAIQRMPLPLPVVGEGWQHWADTL